MRNNLTAAALVPFDATPLQERAELAIRWIVDQERKVGRRAGLITPQMDDYDEPIETFKRGRDHSSIRSPKSFGNGPVLVYCTGMEGLQKAARGDDRPIAYVAWGNDPWVPGWAAVVGAVDLSTGLPSEPPTAEVRELFDALDFAGNHGWHDVPGKRDAVRLLGELDELVARNYVVGAMLAMGHSVRSVTSLSALKVAKNRPTSSESERIDTSRRW
jgi:hypothetical protein